MYKCLGENLEIFSKDGTIPNVPFLEIKNYILGQDFVLNIIFHKEDDAKDLNIKYRDKDYVPNILTFPYDKKEGEIFICKKIARGQYRNFDMTYHNFLKLLIIHGMLHLKGMMHDTESDLQKMNDKEREILNMFV